MKKLIEKALDKLLITKSFQEYVNGRITRNHLNQRFCIDDISQLGNIYSVQEYHIEDIKPDDVVLDLGANIGAFSLPVATKCKHVYAFEPLYDDIIYKNIELNHIKNISVFPVGIGSHGYDMIQHNNRVAHVGILTLKEALNLCKNEVTCLKMDIEGYEWFIKPEEFNGIRRIEGEIHFTNGRVNNGHDLADMYKLFRDYYVYIDKHDGYVIIHATRKQ